MKAILTILTVFFTFALKAQIVQEKSDTNFVKEFKTVQIQAQFPGGPVAWGKYLEKNLNARIASRAIKLRKQQQDSIQTVQLSFVVDTLGQVTDVKVLNINEVHPLVAKEAARVIAEGPKWKPAVQNGKNVVYRQRQTISFLVNR